MLLRDALVFSGLAVSVPLVLATLFGLFGRQ